VGYGYDSIEAHLLAAIGVSAAGEGLAAGEALARRQQALEAIDRRGIIATPQNSSINELVTEAARLSIGAQGRPAAIDYGGVPSVRLG
jgi:hypothetical protein